MDNQFKDRQDKDQSRRHQDQSELLSKEESEDLTKSSQVVEMLKTKGWQVLKDYLTAQIHNKWLDPRAYRSKEELAYAYSLAWGSAQAAEGILRYIEEMTAQNQYLLKKSRGELKEKRIK